MSATNQPKYSQKMLIRVIRQTKDIQDLCDLGMLYKDLEEQGDIIITLKLKMEIRVHQEVLIYRDKRNKKDIN